MAMKSIWQDSFVVRSFLVDAERRLSLFGLLNLLQEAAWLHASDLGHGFQQTRDSGGSWVLARQRIEMERWPEWGQSFSIKTWLRPPGAVLVTRDFEIRVGDEVWGRACAHWLTIDHVTRRPVPLPFPDDPTIFRQDYRLEIDPEKVSCPATASTLKSFEVVRSDLDMNGHVNNTRFSQWVTDSLPQALWEKRRLTGYQVNFQAEVVLGERVSIQGAECAVEEGLSVMEVQGKRMSDERTFFAARLKFQ